jgi:hypothetical protein
MFELGCTWSCSFLFADTRANVGIAYTVDNDLHHNQIKSLLSDKYQLSYICTLHRA